MGPYLAIIKDSFRESLASRVLWVLLGLITLVLLALAPLGWTRHDASTIRLEEIRDIRRLAESMQRAKEADPATSQRFIWNALREPVRTKISDYKPSDRRSFDDIRLATQVAEELSRLVDDETFYDAALWDSIEWNAEAKSLREVADGAPDALQAKRLRRLFVESAFPGEIQSAPREAVLFTYAGWDLGLFPAVPRVQALKVVEQATMGFMSFFIGFVGTLAAILVTASIIPQTFASGTIYLLLSKPISRPLLFLSKFIGSCSFVVICATYLITGMWFILGVRFELWKHQLLFAIPVFLFLFCIYYSVSALAGLIWRSTVMAIVATVVFWFVCTIVGTSKDLIDLLGIQPQRLNELVSAGDEWFAFRQNGEVVRWNDAASQWIPSFVVNERQDFGPMMNRRQVMQLLYDESQNRILALKRQWPQPRILVAHQQDDWLAVDSAAAPRETETLYLEPNGRILAMAPDGVYRLAEELRPAEKGISLFGFQLPTPAPKNYERVTPSSANDSSSPVASVEAEKAEDAVGQAAGDELASQESPAGAETTNADATNAERPSSPVAWTSEGIVAYGGGAIWNYRQGRLSVWRRSPDGIYRETVSRQLALDFNAQWIAASKSLVLLVDDKGAAQVVSFGPHPDRTFAPAFDSPVKGAAISQDQRWLAIHYANDRLWLYDLQEDQDWSRRVPEQGSVTSFRLEKADRLVIASARGVLQELTLPDLAVERTLSPRLSILERVYWYALRPLYLVFPKPKQLSNTTNYLLTGKETESVVMGPPGSEPIHLQLDPWTPVWTSSLFVMVVLGFGCVYMQRQEF